MNSQVLDIVNGIGDFIEYWGFKKVHGKIWAIIFLSNKPVNAKDIMQQLNISKALVSMSLKELMEYDVIMACQEKQSTNRYVSNPNLLNVIVNVLLSREAKMLLQIKNSCELLELQNEHNDNDIISNDRLKKLNQMVNTE